MTQLDDFPLTSPVDLLDVAAGGDFFEEEGDKLRWERTLADAYLEMREDLRRLHEGRPCLTYAYEDMQRSWHGRDGQPMPLWTAMAAMAPAAATAMQPNPQEEAPAVEMHTSFLYQRELMDESQLPPVHVKKEPALQTQIGQIGGLKRTASEAGLLGGPMDVGLGGVPGAGMVPGSSLGYDIKPKLQRRDDPSATVSGSNAPRSLFDRNVPPQAKIRRDKASTHHKYRGAGAPGAGVPGAAVGAGGMVGAGNLAGLPGGPINAAATAVAGLRHPLPRPQVEAEAAPEWVIQEDWALLYAVRELLELPLNFGGGHGGAASAVTNKAHVVNWDMVSDVVNAVSRIYRGPKQCRARYDSIIVPREEGRILYDVTAPPLGGNAAAMGNKGNKKKKAPLKGLPLHLGGAATPAKINKAMKTGQLFSQDGNATWSKLFASRFEQIKAVANKRTPTTKPLMVNPVQKNSKHAAVLAESGITYESPLNPIKVAANRAERIQKEKQRAQLDQQQQLAQQRVQAAQNAASGALQAAAAQRVAAAPILHQQQQQQQQAQQHPAQAVVVGISQPASAGAGAVGQQVIVQSSPQIGRLQAVQQPQPQQIQQQQAVGTVHDIAGRVTAAAAAAQQQQQQQQAVVSVANLTPGQLQAAQKIVQQQQQQTGIIQRGGQLVTAQGKTLTPAQINQLKQHALKKQQEQQQLKARQQQQQAGLQPGTAVLGAATRSVGFRRGNEPIAVCRGNRKKGGRTSPK